VIIQELVMMRKPRKTRVSVMAPDLAMTPELVMDQELLMILEC
jgi:hypothetical protein